jgi:cytochrome b6-f complex iron-sulfur subunit
MTGKTTSVAPSRRDLLILAWKSIGTITLGALGFIGLRFLSSHNQPTDFGGVINAGKVDDFDPGTVTPFDDAHLYLVRAEDGGFLALYRNCPHLNCTILWDPHGDQFHCPCHGSTFTREGGVLNPPAPRPLMRFPIVIDPDRQIQVNTGNRIERTEVSAVDFTYP